MLRCKRPTRFGAVRVNGKFNICAELTKMVVSPLRTSVGNDIDLKANAEDAENDPIAYAWTATGGSIADPSAKETTYTCNEVGNHAVTVTVADEAEYCEDGWTVDVRCVPDASLMPTNEEIFGWVQDLVGMSPRRSGTVGGVGTAEYVADKFRSFGLEDVVIDHGDTLQWRVDSWALTVEGEDIDSFPQAHSFHPAMEEERVFSTGPDGWDREIVYVGAEQTFPDIEVEGRIVVADIVMPQLPLASAGPLRDTVYDPEGTIADHLDPFFPENWPLNYRHAMERGAVAFVGILSNYIDSKYYYNEDVARFGGPGFFFGLPAYWVKRSEGDKLRTILTETSPPVMANMKMEGEHKFEPYNRVMGWLPGNGNTDETIMVQSHHDSTFDGAVEDGTGASEIIALAKYYSQRPAAERDRRLLFITMDTHFTDYKAHCDFIDEYIEGPKKDEVNIVANVAIEHVGMEMIVGENGAPVMTGEVETRIIFANSVLIDLASTKMVAHDYRRAFTLEIEVFGDVISDASRIQRAGVPVINLITGPVYLYDAQDTLDKVAVQELQPTALLFADYIDAIDKIPEIPLDDPVGAERPCDRN